MTTWASISCTSHSIADTFKRYYHPFFLDARGSSANDSSLYVPFSTYTRYARLVSWRLRLAYCSLRDWRARKVQVGAYIGRLICFCGIMLGRSDLPCSETLKNGWTSRMSRYVYGHVQCADYGALKKMADENNSHRKTVVQSAPKR